MWSEGHCSSLFPKLAPPASAPCSWRSGWRTGVKGRCDECDRLQSAASTAGLCSGRAPGTLPLSGAPRHLTSDSLAPGSFTAAWLLFNPDTQGGFARDGCLQRLWLSTWFCPPVSVAQSRLLFAKLDSYPLFPDPLPSVPLVLTSQVIPVSTSHLNPTLTDPGPK